jgi:phosphatidylglycerol:prolipoprotein diacylglycerol transferase
MFPVLFRIFGVPITSFGVMIALAFLAGGWVMGRELRRMGQDPELTWDLSAYAAIFGILGAKIYYLFLYWPETRADPLHAIASRSGLVWYGGFILAALAVALRIRQLKLPVLTFADGVGPSLAVGYAVGRIGCFLVGDDYGGPTSLPWGVSFPNGAPPTTAGSLRAFGVHVPASIPDNVLMKVHPTELYETAMSLVIFGILMALRKRLGLTPGAMWFAWLAMAGVERFIVEIFRAKDDRFFGPFSIAQLISALIFAAGIAGLMIVSRRGATRQVPAVPASA